MPQPQGASTYRHIQHHPKSALSRRVDDIRNSVSSSPRAASNAAHCQGNTGCTKPAIRSGPTDRDTEQWVDHLTEEQREEERRAIIAKFGASVTDLLTQSQDARERQAERNREDHESAYKVRAAHPVVSRCSTRPSSRADHKIRFAELTPQDVHVYESAPPSPRRKILALPPPSGDPSTISLGEWKGTLVTNSQPSSEPVEGVESDISLEDRVAQMGLDSRAPSPPHR